MNQIRPQLIDQFPDMSETARKLISLIPQCKWVENYFSYLNENLRCLKSKQRDDIIRRLVSTEDEKYHEAIAELAYISLWKHLSWSFEKDPNIGGQTPDFKVSGENFGFFCDVAVVRHNNPHEHVIIEKKEDLATPLPPCTDPIPIEQSHRFLMKIEEKFRKYQQICISCNTPLVIAFFLYDSADQFYLDDFQLARALYGEQTINFTTGEEYHQPKIMRTEHGESKVGILTFDEYKPLSAIIVCKQEFYRTSNELQLNPEPRYPLKCTFTFSVYPNPFGEWTDERKNPFPKEEFSVNGLVDIHSKTIKLYMLRSSV